MPSYQPPLRDMRFVLHELLGAVEQLQEIPAHAELDADEPPTENGESARHFVYPHQVVGRVIPALGEARDVRDHRAPPGGNDDTVTVRSIRGDSS